MNKSLLAIALLSPTLSFSSNYPAPPGPWGKSINFSYLVKTPAPVGAENSEKQRSNESNAEQQTSPLPTLTETKARQQTIETETKFPPQTEFKKTVSKPDIAVKIQSTPGNVNSAAFPAYEPQQVSTSNIRQELAKPLSFNDPKASAMQATSTSVTIRFPKNAEAEILTFRPSAQNQNPTQFDNSNTKLPAPSVTKHESLDTSNQNTLFRPVEQSVNNRGLVSLPSSEELEQAISPLLSSKVLSANQQNNNAGSNLYKSLSPRIIPENGVSPYQNNHRPQLSSYYQQRPMGYPYQEPRQQTRRYPPPAAYPTYPAYPQRYRDSRQHQRYRANAPYDYYNEWEQQSPENQTLQNRQSEQPQVQSLYQSFNVTDDFPQYIPAE